MSNNLEKMYRDHHSSSREIGFSILKKERGDILMKAVGESKRVLDIGCRDGALTKFFVNNNNVLGVDIDEHALQIARESLGIEVIAVDLNGDWGELRGDKFDVAVAGEVLEHLYFPDRIIEKVAKHLNSSGIFVGSVPNAFSLKNRIRFLFGIKKHTPLSDPTHINQFHIKELRDLLQSHFTHVELMGLGRYKFLANILPGMFAFDIFFICRK